MSHEVTHRANGKAEMAYIGETPWWKGGNRLAPGQPIEVWKEAAGMDWEILSSRVQYEFGGELQNMNDRVVLHRSDNGYPLGCVSNYYQPVNPTVVIEYFRDLTEAAGYQLETAGTLMGGKRLWAMASIGKQASVADKADTMKGNLLLSTACDGSAATELRYTFVRVVCNNTLGFARSGSKASLKVDHSTKFDPDATKRELGIEVARSRFDDAIEDFRRLAEIRMQPADVVKATMELFFPEMLDKPVADQMKVINRPKGPIGAVGNLALGSAMGSTLSGVKDTAWGWLNAVTEYVDHHTRSGNQDNRTVSAWFGAGDKIKQKAYQQAVEMIGADGRTIVTVHKDVEANPEHSQLLETILAEA